MTLLASRPLLLNPGVPFTMSMALAAGVTREQVRRLERGRLVRRLLESVYVGADVPDSLELRVAALRLVLPPDATAVDETAGWLHGATMILEPGSHLEVPAVHAFQRTPGRRLRNSLTDSGERGLRVTDLCLVGGVLATTPLRTACDLGRLRHRDRAIAAIDSLLRLGVFDLSDLLRELDRFKGYRGVVQLRHLAPLADARAESPPESALRLRCLDAGLPSPVPQYVVAGPDGTSYRLDLALPGILLAIEYDGEEYHSTAADRWYDEVRRDWLRAHGWLVLVLRRGDLFGPHASAEELIRAAYRERCTTCQPSATGQRP